MNCNMVDNEGFLNTPENMNASPEFSMFEYTGVSGPSLVKQLFQIALQKRDAVCPILLYIPLTYLEMWTIES